MATLRIGRPHWRPSGLGSLVPLLWVLIIGIIALYAFFVALGAFSPFDVVPLTTVVAVLALLFGVHSWRESHGPEGVDPELLRARERRGF